MDGAGGEGDLYRNLHILWPRWPSAAAKGGDVWWFQTKAVKEAQSIDLADYAGERV